MKKGYATINSYDNILEEFEWDNLDDCPFIDDDWECCLTGNMISNDSELICDNCPCVNKENN